MENNKQDQSIQILQNKLYWILSRQPPRNRQQTFCFNTEKILFELKIKTGNLQPPSINIIYQFIKFIIGVLNSEESINKIVYYHSTHQPQYKLNSAFLICIYQIMVMDKSIKDVTNQFKNVKFIEYGIPNIFSYSLEEALNSMYIAGNLQLYSLKSKYIESYELYSNQKNGNIYEIIPNKIVIFQWPDFIVTKKINKKDLMNTDDYINTFLKLNITTLIKLQNDQKLSYPIQKFKLKGIQHQSITIHNYSQPQITFFQKVLSILSKEGKYAIISQDNFKLSMLVVAVYIIKQYNLKPKQVIPWCKIMLPGCISETLLLYLKQKYEYLISKKQLLRVD